MLINTHESNLVLTPLFILFVFLEKDIFSTKLKKITGIILPILISGFYYIAKVYIAEADFFVAAASGGHYTFNRIDLFGSVIPTYLQYILQFFNINLSKVAERGQMPLFNIDSLGIKVVSVITVIGFIFLTISLMKKIVLKKEFVKLYFFVFFILILVPASLIPMQMELRWVENAFIVFIILYVIMSYQAYLQKKIIE